MKALQLKPVAYYRLDDTTPLQDYSGYARVATVVGTETHGIPLLSGAAYSQRFSTGNYGRFAAPVYLAGRENQSFSLTAIVYPIINLGTGDQQIVSHGGKYDGLVLNGTTISFSTAYTSSGFAKCSYDMGIVQKAEVVGVHTQNKNSLYVNGVLVDEVDITEAQQSDSYSITDELFYSGITTSSQKVLVNAVGFYSRALNNEEVSDLHRQNSRRVIGSASKMYDGEDISFSTAARGAFINMSWNRAVDWETDSMNNTVVDGDDLVAMMKDGLTLAGTWTDSIDLYTADTPVPINSLNMTWESENAVVEVSLDNTTWTPVVNGRNVSIITVGFDPTDQNLSVRVSFPAGVQEGYISNLEARAFNSSISNQDNRAITYQGPVATLKEQDIDYLRDDWGSRISSGSTIVIGPDTSGTPNVARTVEVWLKPDADTSAVTFGMPITSTYQNGILANTNLLGGQWTLVHYVLTSNVTGAITLNLPGLVGKVSIYNTALTAAKILSISSSYFGVPVLSQTMTGTFSMSEPADAALIYAYDWAIEAS